MSVYEFLSMNVIELYILFVVNMIVFLYFFKNTTDKIQLFKLVIVCLGFPMINFPFLILNSVVIIIFLQFVKECNKKLLLLALLSDDKMFACDIWVTTKFLAMVLATIDIKIEGCVEYAAMRALKRHNIGASYILVNMRNGKVEMRLCL